MVGYTIIFDTCGLDLLTVIYKLDAFALHNRNDFFLSEPSEVTIDATKNIYYVASWVVINLIIICRVL